jgi:hypothetical protein
MSTTYRLQLSIAPISPAEAERTLQAIKRAWCMPSWVRRQTLADQVLLLEVRHEAELKSGESADWFVERIGAAIWQETGRYVRISVDIAPHEAPDGRIYVLDEPAYWRIMQSFRLSSTRFS